MSLAIGVGGSASGVSAGSNRASTPADGAARRQLDACLKAINAGDPVAVRHFVRQRFPERLLKGPVGMFAEQQMNSMSAMSGGMSIQSMEQASEHDIVALARTRLAGDWVRVRLALDPGNPEMLRDLEVWPTVAPAALAKREPDSEVVRSLSEHLETLARADVFSGAVCVARDGVPIFQQAYGLASRAFSYPNNLDTCFNLGSMGKMFTAVAVARLVEKGALSFDQTVASVWPDYPNPAVAAKVTLHHLLTHTTGLGDFFGPEFGKFKDRLRTVADYFPLFIDKPLLFEPGAGWSYSNAGFVVLGAILEKVTGREYWEHIRESVWQPAGMGATGAFELDRDEPNVAVGYTHMGPHGFEPHGWWNNLLWMMPKGCPAGGSYSNLHDLLAFAQALRQHRLLSPSMTDTVLSGKVDEVGPGRESSRYGYGFHEATVYGTRVTGHGGGAPGVNSFLDIYQDRPYDVVVLANCDNVAHLVVNHLRAMLAG